MGSATNEEEIYWYPISQWNLLYYLIKRQGPIRFNVPDNRKLLTHLRDVLPQED